MCVHTVVKLFWFLIYFLAGVLIFNLLSYLHKYLPLYFLLICFLCICLYFHCWLFSLFPTAVTSFPPAGINDDFLLIFKIRQSQQCEVEHFQSICWCIISYFYLSLAFFQSSLFIALQ